MELFQALNDLTGKADDPDLMTAYCCGASSPGPSFSVCMLLSVSETFSDRKFSCVIISLGYCFLLRYESPQKV